MYPIVRSGMWTLALPDFICLKWEAKTNVQTRYTLVPFQTFRF